MRNGDAMRVNVGWLAGNIFLQGQAVPNFLDRVVNNPFFGVLPPTSTFGAGATIAAKNLYYAFPLFNGVTMSTNPWASYRYDSLQLRTEKRFTGNRDIGGALTLVFGYTFSKNFQTANRLNN